MPLAEEIDALEARRVALDAELAALRAELARDEDDLAAGALLWPTNDSELRQCRTHGGMDSWLMFAGIGITAIVLAAFDNMGSLLLATFAAAVLQLRSLRTVIDRRSRTFARRLAWSPRALVATEPLGPVEVRQRVKRSKGQTTTTYEVLSAGRPISDGLAQAEAEQLREEIEAFLAR